MGKGRDRRRRERRVRLEEQQQRDARPREGLAVTAMPTTVNWASVVARFRLLRGRSRVRIAFIPFGLIVQARDPDDLAARALAERDPWPS